MPKACSVNCADRLRQICPEPDDLLPVLKSAIARAARDGQPYTKTGGNGLYERRHELPEAFHAIGKHRLTGWVDALLAQGGTDHGHGRRIQAGQVAGCPRGSGCPGPGGVRHWPPDPLQFGATCRRLIVPAPPIIVPGFPLTTGNARGVGTIKCQQKQGFKSFPGQIVPRPTGND